MWSPTHIHVIVQRARNLLIKGKHDTNNCFVSISLGKEKYLTSIKEKAPKNIEWHEECELAIPEKGNRAELVLTCLHRNNLQLEEFLGQITLPLNEMDVYERTKSKFYKLQSKPGKEKKDKDRGELEVRISFLVKSGGGQLGSLSNLNKKEKKGSTLGLGGSLLSIGTLEKRKGLKKFAKSLGSKMHLNIKKKDKDVEVESSSNSNSVTSLGTPSSGGFPPRRFGQTADDADPGVISEDDEFVFDNLSHKSSGSSINVRSQQQQRAGGVGNQSHLAPPSPLAAAGSTTSLKPPSPAGVKLAIPNDTDIKLRSKTLPPSKPPRIPSSDSTESKEDEWEKKLHGKHLDVGGSADSLKRRSWDFRILLPTTATPPSAPHNEPEISLANTAPPTPNLSDHKRMAALMKSTQIVPAPLPRCATLESINEKEKEKENANKSGHLFFDNNSGNISNSNTINNNKKEKTEKRISKLKYIRKTKPDSFEDLRSGNGGKIMKHFNERIIIGHENDVRQCESNKQLTKELAKKFEGKSREEIILIAHDLENEVQLHKHKMKEMEDYLDNLLLKVMETQPKLLQTPYRCHSITKSG